MGAAPRLALLAMALPPSLPLPQFDAIVSGFAALAAQHRLHLAGGNLTKSPGPLMIDVTVSGSVKRRQVLTRSGARPGDEVYVSGAIGAARAGLLVLKGTTTEGTDTNRGHGSLEEKPWPRFVSVSTVVEQYLRPNPRVRLGMSLGRNRVATACIDLSDGLADGVHRIADASRVGITVDADALPIDAAARAAFERRGDDPLDEAIAGGDDYELLFTVKRRRQRSVLAAARHGGVSLTRIGVCTDGQAIVLRRGGTETPLRLAGYDHFGSPSPGAPASQERASASPVHE
jgi:thiamine-monophosphate kinase